MPLSLKSQLRKLAHKGLISKEESEALYKKLTGHDKEIRSKAIDEFAEKMKENIYPMSHGLGIHDIDKIAETMKNSCISKTFREIDTDYIAEQLKGE